MNSGVLPAKSERPGPDKAGPGADRISLLRSLFGLENGDGSIPFVSRYEQVSLRDGE